MKVVFMGTPDFAAATVDAIAKAGHEIVLVVTQPDKPRGRGKEMQFPAVKTWAIEHDIPVYQPKRIRDAEAVELLQKQDAEIFIVATFAKRSVRYSTTWLCQCTCIVTSQIPWCCTDSMGGYERRAGEWRDNHADGRGLR